MKTQRDEYDGTIPSNTWWDDLYLTIGVGKFVNKKGAMRIHSKEIGKFT